MIAPSFKQIRYAEYLSKVTGLKPYPDWRLERSVCGRFIKDALALSDGRYRREYSDEHTRRILSGGPLKHDPGPWDEGWTEQSENEIDAILLGELRAKGL